MNPSSGNKRSSSASKRAARDPSPFSEASAERDPPPFSETSNASAETETSARVGVASTATAPPGARSSGTSRSAPSVSTVTRLGGALDPPAELGTRGCFFVFCSNARVVSFDGVASFGGAIPPRTIAARRSSSRRSCASSSLRPPVPSICPPPSSSRPSRPNATRSSSAATPTASAPWGDPPMRPPTPRPSRPSLRSSLARSS